ncbi:MAG TPA: outer membrane beta-barrel protein [Lacunisphaera sp.]|nr:outer membrane beta-barrel protein [Lacunisphaera sp.]
MPRTTPTRVILAASLLLAGVTPAGALLNLDGTRNQIFVFGGLTYAYSSNMFAEANARSDYTMSAQAGAELQRRAGIISVNSVAKVDFIRYGEFTDENTVNPNFSLKLSKESGRTTGSLNIQAFRETRSDSAVNLRTTSWNFPVNLDVRYPINERFYTTSDTGYIRRNYAENQGLVDYTDFSEGIDLYYVYTSKLDLSAGYRIRVASTSLDERSTDHWFNVGATGGLFSKMSGTLRFGYQIRRLRGAGAGQYNQFNAAGSVNWPITRKVLLSLALNRDFNTIATGASVDSSSASLRATYSYSRKVDFDGTVSVGNNDFLDPTNNGREDTFASWDAAVRYRMNDHVNMGAGFSYIKNWSSLARADYDNHGFTVDVTSRY